MKCFSLFIISSFLLSPCILSQPQPPTYKIEFNNSTPASIFTITDEGNNASSLTLPDVSTTLVGYKLYNNGGNLFWGGTQIALVGNTGAWTDVGTQVYTTNINDNVGIGTNNPQSLLSVGGDGNYADAFHAETAYGPNGKAVSAYATNSGDVQNFGGFFRAYGNRGKAVYGYAVNTGTGEKFGGDFGALGNEGTGVRGSASGNDGRGVVASASGSDGRGLYGLAFGSNGRAVYGALVSATGYAGYFVGPLHVNGAITGASKSFKIDHPLDPTNKYLLHTSVESSDMMNVYNGNIILDGNGEATVEMADWFEALNEDFRYQLTAIGAPGPNLYIANKINGNEFRIAGGTSGMEVSWQVTGIRHDAWANKNKVPVEQMKPENERGKYLHPEEFNMPKTAGLDYDKKMEEEKLRIKQEQILEE